MTRLARASAPKQPKIILRSSWQTVNIGDIAHTPGMLALLEKHCPDLEITLWPNPLSGEVDKLLRGRFPRLIVATTEAQQEAALLDCHFFLHGSGPGLVGWRETARAREAGKPYGFGGITLNDEEIRTHRGLLAGARFVFLRDTASLRALEKSGVTGRHDFGPDATFAIDLRDDKAAELLMQQHHLERGRFLCAVPRLRWTPYWEIHPDRVKPNALRIAENDEYAEKDHSKLREGITAWVRRTRMRVLLAPEMTYQVSRLRPLLFERLPEDVKPHVSVMDRYWLTAEAAGIYAQAAAVASFEQHSPIIAIANGTPAMLLRQPTDTRKGQMWRDVGLDPWIFEIDQATGAEIAARIVEIGQNLPAARALAAKARDYADRRMADMAAALASYLLQVVH
jgi:polysaccharide pyruvyl transferase WcaK-like protein